MPSKEDPAYNARMAALYREVVLKEKPGRRHSEEAYTTAASPVAMGAIADVAETPCLSGRGTNQNVAAQPDQDRWHNPMTPEGERL
jgi:hypothetical protein